MLFLSVVGRLSFVACRLSCVVLLVLSFIVCSLPLLDPISLFVVCCLLCVVSRALGIGGCSLLVSCRWLSAVHRVAFAVCCLRCAV